MRKIVIACVAVFAASACGGSSHGVTGSSGAAPSPSIQVTDTASVDAAIQRMAHAEHLLSHLSGGLASIEAQYRLAESDARLAAQQLTPTPEGVPDAVARDAAVKFDAVADALEAVTDCLVSGEDCSAVTADMRQKSNDAGVVTGQLIAYSTLTQDQVLAMIQ